jgi:hypothetical protein
MQAVFSKDKQRVKAFSSSLSEARFARYLRACNDIELDAIALYHWNCTLIQSLYFPMHMWEIALRNKLNRFLCWKYNDKWPYDRARAVRNLTGNDRTRLAKAIDRQERSRGTPVSTDAIVADLSAGFWVSQLTQSYTVPYSWKHNITRIFPLDKGIDRDSASSSCDIFLDVRNRMAHHEPIYHLPLGKIRDDLDRVISGMCEASSAYAKRACTFWPAWDGGPIPIPDLTGQP